MMKHRYYFAVIPIIMLAASAWAKSGTEEETTRLAHRTGRVAVNLPEDCSFRISRCEDEKLGIRWPGIGGSEFLGEGGFYLGFRVDGEEEKSVIIPSSFLSIDPRIEAGVFFEGIKGGIRYPLNGCDDDGDGAIDEDPFDYFDNDSDGKTDEDFGVIGNQMIVTRGVDPRTGITLTQSSYTWAYGHVRDFIGFTSVFRYPKDDGLLDRDIVQIESVLCLDFAIGPGDRTDRSEDDTYFFIDGSDEGEIPGTEGSARFAAVSDGGSGRFCSVVVFGFEAPGVSALPDDLMSADTSAVFCGDTGDGGDVAIVSRFPIIPKLSPGEVFHVDWALVFGNSEETLSRNISRALETYEGVVDDDGRSVRWIVPARKASYVSIPGRLAAVWVGGRRKPAASIVLPDMNDEELEWVKIGQNICEEFERVDQRLIVSVEDEVMEQESAFVIEGQFTDGTIFTTRIGLDQIQMFASEGAVSPERLPEEFMSVFPNPFVSNLNIHLRIADTSGQIQSRSGAEFQGMSSVRIYDVKGRLVRTIMPDEYLHPGEYNLGWDGNDDASMPVSPGVYYCKLQIEQRTLTKRVILLR